MSSFFFTFPCSDHIMFTLQCSTTVAPPPGVIWYGGTGLYGVGLVHASKKRSGALGISGLVGGFCTGVLYLSPTHTRTHTHTHAHENA